MEEPRTARGRRTRVRILTAAADLMHRQGVHGTSVDDVLAASDTGKSQFYRYFPSKETLVAQVARHQFAGIVAAQAPLLGALGTWEGIRAWLDAVVAYEQRNGLVGGCPIGSIAAEMADQSELVRLALAAIFDQWQSYLANGLAALQARGELDPSADPRRLAEGAHALLEGGLLLATTSKDIGTLRNALDAAFIYLSAFAVPSVDRSPSQER